MSNHDWRPLFDRLDNGQMLKKDYFDHYIVIFSELAKVHPRAVQTVNNFLAQFREWVRGKFGVASEITCNDEWRYIAEWLGPTDLLRLKITCTNMNNNIRLHQSFPDDLVQTFHIKVLDNIWAYCNRGYLRRQGSMEELGIDLRAPVRMSDILLCVIAEEIKGVGTPLNPSHP